MDSVWKTYGSQRFSAENNMETAPKKETLMKKLRSAVAKLNSRKMRPVVKIVAVLVIGLVIILSVRSRFNVTNEGNKVLETRNPLFGSESWNEKILYDDSDDENTDIADSSDYSEDDNIPRLLEYDSLDMNNEPTSDLERQATTGAPRIQLSVDELLKRYDEAEIEQRLQQRQNHVLEACRDIPKKMPPSCQTDGAKAHIKLIGNPKLTFCAVEKAASTFWLRILKVLSEKNNVTNPLQFMTSEAYSGGYFDMRELNWNNVAEVLEHSTNVMFVRNPFTRIMSAWLDKLYSTNPSYWFSLGRQIILNVRPGASISSMPCGHDVTFEEFVTYMVKLMQQPCIDPHFSPMYQHCFPCNVTYSYIGAYENLMEDTLYILKAMDVSQRVTFASNIEEQAEIDAILDAANWVFANRRNVEKCMSFRHGLSRVWRRLQARGFLSKWSSFDDIIPASEMDPNMTFISEEQFRTTLLKTRMSYPYEERVQNRNEALYEAFQSLPPLLLHDFVIAFIDDFKVFGYSYPHFVPSTDVEYPYTYFI